MMPLRQWAYSLTRRKHHAAQASHTQEPQRSPLPVKDPKRISFLAFPYEIRVQVYHHCLVSETRQRLSLAPREPDVNVKLLRVCKLLHRECTPVVYSENRFRLVAIGAARSIGFVGIGPTTCSLIRDLELFIGYTCYSNSDSDFDCHMQIGGGCLAWENLARSCPRLTRLTLSCEGSIVKSAWPLADVIWTLAQEHEHPPPVLVLERISIPEESPGLRRFDNNYLRSSWPRSAESRYLGRMNDENRSKLMAYLRCRSSQSGWASSKANSMDKEDHFSRSLSELAFSTFLKEIRFVGVLSCKDVVFMAQHMNQGKWRVDCIAQDHDTEDAEELRIVWNE